MSLLPSDANGGKSSSPAEVLTSEDQTLLAINQGENGTATSELDKKLASEFHVVSLEDEIASNECDEDPSKKGKLQAAKDNIKRFNMMFKSKIDGLGRAPALRAKKKNEKQEKKDKRLSFTKSNKQDESKIRHSAPELPDVLLTVNSSTAGLSEKDPSPSAHQTEADQQLISWGVDQVDSGDAFLDLCSGYPEESLPSDIAVPSPVPFANPASGSATDGWNEERNQEQSADDMIAEFMPDGDPTSVSGQMNSGDGELNLPFSTSSGNTWATVRSKSSSIMSVNRGCLEGSGPAVPVDFRHPVVPPNLGGGTLPEYTKFFFQSVEAADSMNSQLEQADMEGFEGHTIIGNVNPTFEEQTYYEDPYDHSDMEAILESEDDYWGSEFDESSYQDEVLHQEQADIDTSGAEQAPGKPLPPKPEKKPFFSRTKSNTSSAEMVDESGSECLSIIMNSHKHSLPTLPPQPDGLTTNQIKRRKVVESIISSERSYLESLERLVKEYEQTVLAFLPKPKSHVKRVFSKMREIATHHLMFQIELSESVKAWDQQEKIGDIFTASFSKTILINAYSVYINNFAAAMDEIRLLQRSRQTFQDFLMKQEKLSADRLSIFGLMVKPVQRFPQFIMFLQDLIKNTPNNHPDRMALQLALTELENVASRLNEQKRQSEQKFQARLIVQQLIKQKVQHVLDTWNLDVDPKRKLLRSDSLEQVLQQGDSDNLKYKDRRLIMMNDHILCVKVIQKEHAGFTVERLALRWMAKLKDVELKVTSDKADGRVASTPDSGPSKFPMGNPNKSNLDESSDDPFHLLVELNKMVGDHEVIQEMITNMSMLQRSYAGYGLREELLQEISHDLKQMIQIKQEQLRLVNSCSIVLVDGSRPERPHCVFRAKSAAFKREWCLDFVIAKLALEKSNNSAWGGPFENEGNGFETIPAYFMKHVPVDVPKNYTKAKCAVSFYLNSKKSANLLGVQQLWVCSSTAEHGQVSILSVVGSKPALVESFRACSCDILAVELVSSNSKVSRPEELLFAEDTVWMATADSRMIIFPLTSIDGVHRQPLASVTTRWPVVCLRFLHEQLFCGSNTGEVSVYSHQQDQGWDMANPTTLSFGDTRVNFHFVHEDFLWMSCGNRLCQLDIDSLETETIAVLHAAHSQGGAIGHVVRSGVGLWVSFVGSSVIKLYHLETMENLQEISVGSFVSRLQSEKSWVMSEDIHTLAVTCLGATRGVLWIGTSLGLVFSLPLPRLSDGVPLYRGSPQVSTHAHKGPVRFFTLLHCSADILEMKKALAETTHSHQSLDRTSLETDCGKMDKDSTVTTHILKSTSQANLGTLDLTQSKDDPRMSSLSVGQATEPAQDKLVASNSRGHSSMVNISGINKETSLDDSSVQLRHKKKMSEINRQSQTLNVFSSHPHTQRARSHSQSILDLSAVEPHEVEVLYHALLQGDVAAEYRKVGKINSPEFQCKEREERWSVGHRFSASFNIKDRANQVVNKATHSFSVADAHTSVSSNPKLLPGLSPKGQSLSPVTGFLESRTADITRALKSSTSAVIIVSGGDGYTDYDKSRKDVRVEDSCVMFWVHKC